MVNKHAKLAASAAHRWIACPGSVRMSEGIEDTPSAAAREGTRAHAFGEQILAYWLKTREPERGLRARFREGTTIKWVVDDGQFDTPAVTENWNVDQETLDHVMVYVNEVIRLVSQNKKAKLYLEQHLSLEHVRADMGGTTDAVVVSPECLSVVDYKHGFVAVRLYPELPVKLNNVKRVGLLAGVNPQLLIYAAGAIEKFQYSGNVTLTIVQPRSMEVDAIQTIGLSSEDIKDWAENYLWERACATEMGDAPLAAGEHCRFCPAAGRCPELAKRSLGEAAMDFEEVVGMKTQNKMILGHEVDVEVEPAKPAVLLDAKSLSRVLRAAPMIDSWLRECEAAAHAMMERGEKVDGFKLVRKRSNREWPAGIEHSRDLLESLLSVVPKNHPKYKLIKAKLYGPAALEATEMLSPAKVEKLIGKEFVDQVAVKPDAGLTIAAESDKREAISSAVTDFSDLL